LTKGGPFLVTHPAPDWSSALDQCHDYVSNSEGWGLFAEYVGDICEDLCYIVPGMTHLNGLYRSQLAGFTAFELETLRSLLQRAVRSAALEIAERVDPDEFDLWQRLLEVNPDFSIASTLLKRTIKEIRVIQNA